MRYLTNKEVQEIVATPCPVPGFGYRLKENPDGVWLIVSLEEMSKFSGPQQERIAEFLGNICNSLRSKKIPCFIHREDHDSTGKSE